MKAPEKTSNIRQVLFLLMMALAVGFLLGYWFHSTKPSPPKHYAVVEKDIDLRHINPDVDIRIDHDEKLYHVKSKPRSFGTIKKGTIVESGNLLKGGRQIFIIRDWISEEYLNYLGDKTEVEQYIEKNSDFYESHVEKNSYTPEEFHEKKETTA